MVVDCQSLARALDGDIPFHSVNPDILDQFASVGNSLREWVVKQGLPSLLAAPVEWRDREVNKMADYLANKSMDEKKGLVVDGGSSTG